MPILTKGNPLFTSPSTNLSPDQDALRWRGLMERVRNLELQMQHTVKYGANGAAGGSEVLGQTLRAGAIIASTITSATINAALIQGPQPVSGPFMSLDMTGSLAGTRPLLIVNDGTVRRFEAGNMAANGVSPAGYGFRVSRADGSPLLDHLGPIGNGVMNSLGISGLSGAQNFTTTTPTLATGTNMTITISNRAQNVLCLALVIGSVTSGTNNGQWRINPGGAGSASGNAQLGGGSAQTQMAWLWLASVAVGSYTFQLEGSVSATPTTFNMTGANLQVFQLGS